MAAQLPSASALPSAAAAAAELAPLPAAGAPPLDWSLKTCVRLLAPEPFVAFEAAGQGSAGARCDALRRFAAGRPAEGGLQVRPTIDLTLHPKLAPRPDPRLDTISGLWVCGR